MFQPQIQFFPFSLPKSFILKNNTLWAYVFSSPWLPKRLTLRTTSCAIYVCNYLISPYCQCIMVGVKCIWDIAWQLTSSFIGSFFNSLFFSIVWFLILLGCLFCNLFTLHLTSVFFNYKTMVMSCIFIYLSSYVPSFK